MTITASDLIEVEEALAKLPGSEFFETATDLLNTLGYKSDLIPPDIQSTSVDDFIRQYGTKTPDTKTKQLFKENVKSIRILFQFTAQEITAQGSLFNTAGFDTSKAQSFLFVAVELKDGNYPRGKYASFAREINKCWQIPTIVLFRTSKDDLLTLAFVHHRPHKRDPKRDVLDKVSLIREIKPADPHRAHLDILTELGLEKRLKWMDNNRKSRDFDGLRAAWLDALDTEELNRRFYRELLAWFERAKDVASFPTTGARVHSPQQHVIRLITRLLFIWFIKEKNLVAEELFIEDQVRKLLKDYDSEKGDSYYRAVLQNLFFATLNTEIGPRDFSRKTNVSHRDFSLYRYASEIANPDRLKKLFQKTPFINGGLFDCLDSEKATRDGGYRIDYFSDNVIRKGTAEYAKLSIPNHLFFGPKGLITLFNRYKFTVEENTPAEQEVALDPELLGKVFENLLAAHTPETEKNARKQTGSYYTPRPVVDYMVDEALVAALVQKVAPDDADRQQWVDRLHYLFDYNDAGKLFEPDETDRVVQAIAKLRVLDPAVGSGAFPMGVLHKLTLALRRLDPRNTRWQDLQRKRAKLRTAAAFDTANTKQARDEELAGISETFERYRDSDFGRKLYLIQNSIYGVDIQPVAIQIAKLRFFISLAIEQQPTDDKNNNYGIHPLPNLETRFVAANTLLGLEQPSQPSLDQIDTINTVNELKQKLHDNRERHFHANSRPLKLACSRKYRQLRHELAATLKEAQFLPDEDANKVAFWDPYDQNEAASWFEPVYMFGVEGGFDVVIGNPPYIRLQKVSKEPEEPEDKGLWHQYRDGGYATFDSTGDIYQLFYEKGFGLLAEDDILAYITSNSWLKAKYGKSTRRFMSENHTPLRLLEAGKRVFKNVIVDTSVLIARSGNTNESAKAVDMDRLSDKTFPPDEKLWHPFHLRGEQPWSVLSKIEQRVKDKMHAIGIPLKDWDTTINYGIKTGRNEAFIIDNQTKEALVAEDPRSVEIIKPIVRGKDIQRYKANWEKLWLIATFPALNLNIDDYPAVKKHLLSFGKARLEQSGERFPDGTRSRKKTGNAWYEMQDTCAYHADFTKEKLVWITLVNEGRFAYNSDGMFCLDSVFMMIGSSLKYLCAVLNTRLISWFMKDVAPTSGEGTLQWKKEYVESLPIPRITVPEQQPFIQLLDRILLAKTDGQNSDTLEIDDRVYQLYGLTPLEISVVREYI